MRASRVPVVGGGGDDDDTLLPEGLRVTRCGKHVHRSDPVLARNLIAPPPCNGPRATSP